MEFDPNTPNYWRKNKEAATEVYAEFVQFCHKHNIQEGLLVIGSTTNTPEDNIDAMLITKGDWAIESMLELGADLNSGQEHILDKDDILSEMEQEQKNMDSINDILNEE